MERMETEVMTELQLKMYYNNLFSVLYLHITYSVYILPHDKIQCGVIITQLILWKKSSQKIPHILYVRAKYGVPCVYLNFASLSATMHAGSIML